MRLIYKYIAAVLLLALMAVNNTAYANNIDADSPAYTEKEIKVSYDQIHFLQSVNVFDKSLVMNFDSTISRQEFAAVMGRLLGYEAVNAGSERKIKDVDSGSKYAGYIHIAIDKGMMKLTDDELFKPEVQVNYEDAVKAVIIALGYDIKAIEKGGWPIGYTLAANDLGILKDVDGHIGYPITMGNIARMLVRSVEVDLLMKIQAGDRLQYTTIDGRNILTEYLKLEKVKGIVEETEKTHLIKNSSLAKNRIRVNDKIYKTESDCSNLLGYRIEFYADTQSEDERKILYIKKANDFNDIKIISADDIESYQNRVYKYSVSDEVKQIRVSASCYVIYNGRALDSYTDSLLKPESGYITLIDNDNDSNYDVLSVTSYQYYVANYIDEDEYIIYDKFRADQMLDLDMENVNSRIYITNNDGEPIGFDAIKPGNVLSVAQSRDGMVCDIVVSNKKITGKIEEKSLSDNNSLTDRVTVNGAAYKVLKSHIGDELDIDKIGTLYLDYEEKVIAFYEGTDTSRSCGYLINAQILGGLENQLRLKVFDESNKIINLKCAKKIKMDNVSGQESDKVLEVLKKKTNSVLPQVIYYRLDNEGYVDEMDTPYNNDPALATDPNDNIPILDSNTTTAVSESGEGFNSLRIISKAKSLIYKDSQMTFNGKFNITGNTKIFSIPSDLKDTDNFSTKLPSNLKNDLSYRVEAYSSTENDLTPNVLLMFELVGEVKYGVVTKIVQCLENDGDLAYKATVQLYSGVEEIYTNDPSVIKAVAADNASGTFDLREGDIIKYTLHEQNKIHSISMLYRASEKNSASAVKFANSTNTAYTADDRLVFANVYKKYDNLMAVTKKDPSDHSQSINKSDLEIYSINRFKIFIVKSVNGAAPKLEPGYASDIIDYQHNIYHYTKAFMMIDTGDPRLMVIYK